MKRLKDLKIKMKKFEALCKDNNVNHKTKIELENIIMSENLKPVESCYQTSMYATLYSEQSDWKKAIAKKTDRDMIYATHNGLDIYLYQSNTNKTIDIIHNIDTVILLLDVFRDNVNTSSDLVFMCIAVQAMTERFYETVDYVNITEFKERWL